MEKIKFYSQFNQDEIVNNLLANKKDGFFVDIGAYDGVTFSNSYFFEKYMNWKGICFEPNPVVFEKLSASRKCKLVNGGVGVQDSGLTFTRYYGNHHLEMYSGFSDFFSEHHKKRLEQELAMEKNSGSATVKIPVYNVNKLLEENGIKKIDYCSIDTEGGEFEILKTIDFDKFYFSVLTIENNHNGDEMKEFMHSKGFKFLFQWKCDLYFVNEKEKINVFSNLKNLKYHIIYLFKQMPWLFKISKSIYGIFFKIEE